MAKLSELPAYHIISGFKGKIDFYVWKGLNIARKWPKKPLLPRAPAVAAAGAAWAELTADMSFVPPELRRIVAAIFAHTSWTWRDAYTTAAFNHNVDWTPTVNPPGDQPLDENVMHIDLIHTFPDTFPTQNVNSTNYVATAPRSFLIPGSKVPFTTYRVMMFAQANQAGQTVKFRIAKDSDSSAPLGNGTDELTVTNAAGWFDSGWKNITADISGDIRWNLYPKGSNASVDFLANTCYIVLSVT